MRESSRNSDSVLSGSLVSPKPPGVGEPEEHGMQRARRNHGASFKAQMAFAVFKDDKTLAELATQ